MASNTSSAGAEDRAADPADVADVAEEVVDPLDLADKATIVGTPGPVRETRITSEHERISLLGLSQFYGLRITWSRWLIGWVTALVVFQIILTLLVGAGALDFKGYDGFLNITVGANFVQVISLAVIVVRFLHSGKSSNGDDPPPI